MSNDQQQPGPPKGIPPEMAAAAQMLGAMLRSFAPHITEEQAFVVAVNAISHGEQLSAVISDAADPQSRVAHPIWGYKLTDGSGNEGVVQCPKDVRQAQSLQEVMHHAMVIALVTSPPARAVLAAYGYQLEFFQAARKEESQIILPD
jgi:hypothetical protein